VQSRCRQRSQCRQASLDPGALERKCTPCHRARAGAAALVELVAEPLYILGAAQLRFGLRVGAEAAATLARGALTLALLARGACAPALALSWGQARRRARRAARQRATGCCQQRSAQKRAWLLCAVASA
jgi:hypothetical protein